MTRIQRDTPPSPANRIHISAARGEWEAFQVILTAAPAEIQTATLAATPWRSESGATIPAPTIFREHFVRVTHSTPMSPLPPGDYPDALVPQDFPRQKLPQTAITNQPYYFDTLVPRDAKPGIYRCLVSASVNAEPTLRVTATLTVFPFSLPEVPKLRTQIGTVWRDVAKAHGFDPSASTPSPELRRILDAYHDLLAEHRLSIDHIYDGFPDADTGRLDEKKVRAALQRQLHERHAANIALPLWFDWPFPDPLGADRQRAMQYVAAWCRIVASLNAADRAYAYFGDLDEPHLSKSYGLVKKWGAFFDEVEEQHHVRIPFFVTEKPTPRDPSWPDIRDSADIWVPLVEDVWTDLEGPNPTRDIARQLAKGREVWAYPALVQIPNDWLEQRGWPKTLREGNAPSWILDFPPMNYRILAWLMPRHGITGFSYWDTIHGATDVDVWSDAGNFTNKGWDEKIYNGDGLLIYPATKKRHGIDMPCASLRLKWARETCDDYDYLTLAIERGHKVEALRIASTFARGFGDWNDNVSALYEARRQIADLLSK